VVKNNVNLGLDGRTARVTGASKSIGRAIGERLAAEGCDLHIVSRTRETIERAAQKIQQQHGISAAAHALDLSNSKNIRPSFDTVGNADMLVDNASAIPGGDLQMFDEARWGGAWDLKIFGFINLCRAFYAAMQERGAGVMINFTGLAADRRDTTLSRVLPETPH
jgi:short-subunit dehydrogenase